MSAATVSTPAVRARLRRRPPDQIRRARAFLYGYVALVTTVVVALVIGATLLRANAAWGILLNVSPAAVAAVLAVLATRGFRDRTIWSFVLAIAVAGALILVAGLMLNTMLDPAVDAACRETAEDEADCGNAAFGLGVVAGLLLLLGLPVIWNLILARAWFFARDTGGPAIATAETLRRETAASNAPAPSAASAAPVAWSDPSPAWTGASRDDTSTSDGLLVSVRGLKKHFPILGGVLRRQVGTVYAVDGVDFDVKRGEVFALVGESGCGKTTLGRTLLQLTPPTAGKVIFDGYELDDVDEDDMRPLRRRMQIIFQDPFGSLNPRMPVSDIIGEGLYAQGVTDRADRDKRVEDALEIVGLRRDYTRRYPHEFSGGQRQRIGVARALALDPDFIVCDEPVSALDVSIQSQVLNLLLDLKRDFNLTYLFISHNLSVVEYFSDRIGVMYLGKIVEMGTVEDLYRDPRHPYTVALLSAIPEPDPRRRRKCLVLKGDVPSPAAPPSGCRFHTRCWLRERLGNPEQCATTEPELRVIGGTDHRAACHFAEQIDTSAVEQIAAQQSVLETAAADPA